MNIFRGALFLILGISLWSCGDDSPNDTSDAPPTVTITGNFTNGSTVCVGQTLQAVIEMNAEAGISTYTIFKNGTEEIATAENVIFNTIAFNLVYLFNSEDLENGEVDFTIDLTDIDNRKITQEISFQVVAEYAYSNENVTFSPSFDLANNVTIIDEQGPNVDIFLDLFTESCGSFCTNSRYTVSSRNGSRFYNLPFGSSINFTNNSYKQADVAAAIAGISPDTSLVVYSTFPEDNTANGFLNAFPFVVDIRGTGEFAIVDAVIGGNNTPAFRYKKRTETSGQ